MPSQVVNSSLTRLQFSQCIRVNFASSPRARRGHQRMCLLPLLSPIQPWGSQIANRKRKRKVVPKHTVDISLHASDLAKAGAAVTFKVHSRNGLLGIVEIGQGSFRWKGAKKRSFKRIPWTRLAAGLDAY